MSGSRFRREKGRTPPKFGKSGLQWSCSGGLCDDAGYAHAPSAPSRGREGHAGAPRDRAAPRRHAQFAPHVADMPVGTAILDCSFPTLKITGFLKIVGDLLTLYEKIGSDTMSLDFLGGEVTNE